MPSPPLGLSAFTLTSQSEGATMALTSEPNEAFDRLVVCGIMQHGAGRLTIHAGTETSTFDLDSPTGRPECRTVRLTQPTTNADLTVSGGPVTLTSWATFNDHGGVVLSNLGVVGSQLVHWARTDDAVLSEELAAYRPDLIVLAFGTNEGFAPRVNDFEYEATLRTQIGRIRRLAGNVPILMLGAPDALSRRGEMRANTTSGEASPDCGAPQALPSSPQPSTFETIVNRLRNSIGMAPSDEGAQGQPAQAAASPPPPAATGTTKGPLFPPAGLKLVRDVQRRVARQLNVAFWDWEARLGGRCYADAWVHANPPLMRTDYVHYTLAGGKEVAQRLEADLEQAMVR